jgi:hypothetical protein
MEVCLKYKSVQNKVWTALNSARQWKKIYSVYCKAGKVLKYTAKNKDKEDYSKQEPVNRRKKE